MQCLVPVAPDSSSYRVWLFKIRVYLGGPVAPICTINKTKSSSSCLQLELVLFYYLRPRNPRAVTPQHHENPPRPRPRPQHPRQTLPRRKIPRNLSHDLRSQPLLTPQLLDCLLRWRSPLQPTSPPGR